MPKLRSPARYPGGKSYMVRHILPLLPAHHTFVETHGGSAAVLLNKPPSPVEVYNDIDGDLTNLFRVVRDHGEAFRRALSLTPYSEAEFDRVMAEDHHEQADPVERARRLFVKLRMSMGGAGKSFAYTLHRVRRGMADVVSGYLSSIDEHLPAVIERLRTVQILNRPAEEVIPKWDGPDTVTYMDPPYAHESRQTTDLYRFEMSDEDHVRLAEVAHACKGKVLVSGYDCPLYRKLYGDWRAVRVEMANHAAGGKTKRRMTEVVWLNYPAPPTLFEDDHE
jgi:DNA adenine methylase